MFRIVLEALFLFLVGSYRSTSFLTTYLHEQSEKSRGWRMRPRDLYGLASESLRDRQRSSSATSNLAYDAGSSPHRWRIVPARLGWRRLCRETSS